jgi:prepilin signal peptidase PulO-like enzyme (type II secretory pathway)
MAAVRFKIIVVYGLVILFSTLAFVALGYLFDTPLTELYLESESIAAFEESANMYEVNKQRINRFITVNMAAPYVGTLFGLVLSFIAFRRKKLDKRLLLPIAAFALLVSLFNPATHPGIRDIFFAPGQLVSNTVTVTATINYLLWLGLSFWLAFSKRLIPGGAGESKV